MKISTLTIELAANVARLRQDMDKAQRTVQTAMGGISKAVSVATAAFSALGAGVAGVNFTQWIRGAINAADEASKLAQKTGLLVKEVAGLQLAFDQAGAGDQFKGALARLSKEAAAGNEAFAAMGITIRKQDGTLLSTRELIGEVADRFASYRDSAEKTALAQELFGKAGADLIPLLNAGAASLADYDAKAKALGITLDEESAKAAEKFNDEMDLLMRRADGAAVALSGPIVQALNTLTDRFNAGTKAGESFLAISLKAYTQNVKDFYGVNDYADTRKELERVNAALQSGKLNTMQTLAFEEKRAALAKTMAGYLSSQAGAGRGSINPAMVSLQGSGTAPIVPRAGGGGGRSGGRSGAAATTSEFDRLSQQLTGQVSSAWADAQAAAMGYNQAQEEFLRLAASPQWAALTNEQRAQLAVLSEKLILQQQEAVAVQQLARVQEEARAAYAASLQASTQGADAAARRVLEMQQEAEALALAEQRQIGLAEAVELTAIARLRERQAAAMGDEAMVLAIQREIEAREKLVTMLGDKRIQDAAQKSAEAAAVEWEKVTTKIEDMLTDALMRGFESGKGFGENLGDSLVNLFKTFVAREIANAVTQAMVSALAKTQFASALGGGGGGSGAGGLFMQAISAYFGGGTGGGGGGGMVGLLTQAYAAYQTYTATAVTVTTAAEAASASAALSAELAASQAAAASASASTAAASSSAAGAAGGSSAAGGLSATGWGALIVAAVVSANNLYRAGYNRAALSSAGDAQRVGSFSSTTGMGGGGSSAIYSGSVERLNRSILDAAGISEKWSDILSGTTRMAATFGRKLAFAGFSVGVNGSDTSVKGVEQYRGGVFRSDRTREFAVDPRDQKMVQDLVAQTRAAAIENARAAGLSTEAIENWNGRIAINFKGVKTAAEETERYNKALNKAYTQMIKAAQQATFDANIQKQVEAVRENARTMAAALGLSTESIKNFSGTLGVSMKEMDGSEGAARKLAKASEDLYYQMLQSTAGFNMTRGEFEKFLAGVVQSAEAVGISAKGIADVLVQGMTGRLSRADVGDQLGNIIVGGIYNAIAQNYANTIAQAFTSQIITPIFTAIASGVPISQAISQQAIKNVVATAQAASAALNAVFSSPDFQAAIRGIQQAISGVSSAATSVRVPMKTASSSFKSTGSAAKQAAEDVRSAWQSVADSIVEEIRRIRGEIATESGQGTAYFQSQFLIATSQARAGDRAAAERLPELSQSLLEAAELSVKTAAEMQRLRAWTAQVLQDTAGIVGARFGLRIPAFATGTDYVPRDMLAMVHKGERITPAPFNPVNSPENAQAAAIELLAAKVDRVAAILTDIEGNTDDSARVLRAAAANEQPIGVTTT